MEEETKIEKSEAEQNGGEELAVTEKPGRLSKVNFLHKINLKSILIIAGLVVLIVASVVAGYILYAKLNPEPESRIIEKEVVVSEESSEDTSAPVTSKPVKEEEKTIKKVLGEVTWQEPKKIEALDIFRELEEGKKDYYSDLIPKDVVFYKVGVVDDKEYSGAEVVLLEFFYVGPSFSPSFIHLLKTKDENLLDDYILLLDEELSDEHSAFDVDRVTVLTNLALPLPEYPDTFNGPSTRQILKRDKRTDGMFDDINLTKVFTSADLGPVYTTKDGHHSDTEAGLFGKDGFYIKAPDGTTRVYYLEIDFIGEDTVPSIVWSDGSVNNQGYLATDSSGCGSSNYTSVLKTVTIENDLEIIGESTKGDKIYGLKDEKHPLLAEFGAVSTWTPGDEEMVVENILGYRPVIFFVDPFGRLVKMESTKFTPPAECGKPVIYLYPEEETQVKVEVDPQGGFTYSDPDYGNGWLVNAKPNGDLTEVKSGNEYPYLFWEGRGGIYEQPEKGFVVEQEEVHEFLVEKLNKLGLIEQEIADFIEFWEPRMQDSPYYFVTFLGNRDMNRLAPLNVTPKPDTIIRILMDFSPLEEPIEVEEFEIRTPERKGFVVSEWGGVIR